jgi:hypothetical protein
MNIHKVLAHSILRMLPYIGAETADRNTKLHTLKCPSNRLNVPIDEWRDQELRRRNLPDHVFEHLLTMAQLHAANRYDRLTHDVEAILGRPATSVRDFVARHAEFFGPSSPSAEALG